MDAPVSPSMLLRPLLGPRETLLWSGRPRQGIFLRGSDVLLIPFSLLWGGFAIFWETMALSIPARIPQGAGPTTGVPAFLPMLFPLWGLPFVAMGLYMIIGRFFVDRALRSRTVYGVTSERAIIVSGWFSPTVQSLNLRTLSDVTLQQKADGSGTITFGPRLGIPAGFAGSGWPMRRGTMPPCFDSIADARSVFALVQKGQLEAP